VTWQDSAALWGRRKATFASSADGGDKKHSGEAQRNSQGNGRNAGSGASFGSDADDGHPNNGRLQQMRIRASGVASDVKNRAEDMRERAHVMAAGVENQASEAIGEKNVSKIKKLVRDYGPVGIGIYGGIYVGTLASLYALVEIDVISAKMVLAKIDSLGLNAYFDTKALNNKAGNFALAWILTKFTEPLRLLTAITITPSIARAIGWAPPKKEKI